jgi:hypothetical protein
MQYLISLTRLVFRFDYADNDDDDDNNWIKFLFIYVQT